jgi:hypothetical protein
VGKNAIFFSNIFGKNMPKIKHSPLIQFFSLILFPAMAKQMASLILKSSQAMAIG